jgi:hypothetical protein
VRRHLDILLIDRLVRENIRFYGRILGAIGRY